MKNVLITGATGFLGSHLLEELLNNEIKVTAIVRKNSKNHTKLPQHKNLKIIQANLDDKEEIKKQIADEKIDTLYHLAWGGTRSPERDDSELQKRNYEQTIDIVKTAIEIGCETIICTGSQAEYGICKGKITEEHPTNPVTEYGKYKLKACNNVINLSNYYHIRCNWVRIFSLYGFGDSEKALIIMALKKMINNEDIELTDCTQKWDYLHIKDAAKTLRKIGNSKCETGIYNLASGESKQLKEYILQMKKITNSKSKLLFGKATHLQKEKMELQCSIDKIKQNIEMDQIINFKEGVVEIINRLKCNENPGGK